MTDLDRAFEEDRPAEIAASVLGEHGPLSAAALGDVLPEVYAELREVAVRAMLSGSPTSLQPTDLVHEAYLRLSRERQGWDDRAHLMVAAAVSMRRALVDYVRRKRSAKRGGDRQRESALDTIALHDRRFDTLDLEDALRALEAEDADASQVAELRIFGGYDTRECAHALAVSTRTIERRWRFARAWLMSAFERDEEQAP